MGQFVGVEVRGIAAGHDGEEDGSDQVGRGLGGVAVGGCAGEDCAGAVAEDVFAGE